MLKKRIITACILALILIANAFLPVIGFDIFLAAITAIAAWEWSNFADISKISTRVFYVLSVLLFSLCIFLLPKMSVLVGAGIFWISVSLAIIFYPVSSRYWAYSICRGLLGLIALSIMWFSFVFIREQSNGIGLILILWAMIALADIGAYFVGHAIGNKKLAPLVSPNKTIEGVYGGLSCAAFISFLANFFYSHSLKQALWCAVVAIAVAIASIIGDLLESMLKRFRGIKDSGHLLPGHGGLLDRIDGWTAAAPMFAFFIGYLNVVIL